MPLWRSGTRHYKPEHFCQSKFCVSIPDSGEQGYQVFRIVKIRSVTNYSGRRTEDNISPFQGYPDWILRGVWRPLARAGAGGMTIQKQTSKAVIWKLTGSWPAWVPASSALISSYDGDKWLTHDPDDWPRRWEIPTDEGPPAPNEGKQRTPLSTEGGPPA